MSQSPTLPVYDARLSFGASAHCGSMSCKDIKSLCDMSFYEF
jgi:hypothetical protein